MDFHRVLRKNKWIHVGNKGKVEVLGIGTCKLVLRGGRVLLLHDVLYVLEIRQNLIFVLLLIKSGFCLNFYDTSVNLFSKTNYYGSGCWDNGFIVHDLVSNNNVGFSFMTSSSSSSDNDMNVWHSRLGHIGQQRMNKLTKESLLGPLKKVNLLTCLNCLKEKMIKKTIWKNNQSSNSIAIGSLRHLWSNEREGEAWYFIFHHNY